MEYLLVCAIVCVYGDKDTEGASGTDDGSV